MLKILSVHHDKGTRWYKESGDSAGWSFVIVVYGSCVYWIEGKKVVAEKGDLLLIPGDASFYGKSIPTLAHEKYAVTFREEASSAAGAPALRERLPILGIRTFAKWKTGMHDRMADRFREMHEQWTEAPPYGDVLAQALLLELLVHANRELDKGTVPSEKLRLVEAMRTYIQLHHREPVTKEQVAEAVGKSPNYAATVYKSVTGRTIGETVHAARMKTAAYLLRHSLLTVADISEYVGYADPSYFYRQFKRILGHSPSRLLAERESSPG